MLTRESNPRTRRSATAGTIDLLEKRVGTMELKEELTKEDIQSIMRIRKLLNDVSNDFKIYHFAIVDQLEGDAEEAKEQKILNGNETKVMELIDCIAELIKEPLEEKKDAESEFETAKASDHPPINTKDRMVDRQLGILDEAARSIKKALEECDLLHVDHHLIKGYMDKIRSLEGELQEPKKNTVP